MTRATVSCVGGAHPDTSRRDARRRRIGSGSAARLAWQRHATSPGAPERLEDSDGGDSGARRTRPTAPEGDLISTHDTPAAAPNRPTTTPFSTPASDSAGTPVRRDDEAAAPAETTDGAAPTGPPAAYTVDWSNPEAMKDTPTPRPANGSATPRTTGFASDAAPIPAISWSDPR